MDIEMSRWMIMILAVVMLSHAGELDVLRAEKRAYKKGAKSHVHKKEHRLFAKVILVFEEDAKRDFVLLAHRFGLIKQRCIIGRMCIFTNSNATPLDALRNALEAQQIPIETLYGYQKRHFTRY